MYNDWNWTWTFEWTQCYFYQMLSSCDCCFPVGIDKLTEKSQVSEDGTMVSIPKTDSSHAVQTEHCAASAASDTESNSGRENEVRVCICVYLYSSCSLVFKPLTILLLTTRMFSTRKQKWRKDVCRVLLHHRSGLLHLTGWGKKNAILSFCVGHLRHYQLDACCPLRPYRCSPGSVSSPCRLSCVCCKS